MDELKRHIKGDTGRLAATYLAIIMALTLMFSVIIYGISSSQFDRPLPRRDDTDFGFSQFDDSTRSNVQQLFHQRAVQARAELLLSLVFLNVVVLTGGAALSYYLARRTLEPIEEAMDAQNQFVSDASHELRTPLAALQVTNEVALRKKKLTLIQAKDLISYNLAETIKLRDLSDALLGLAKQSSSRDETTKVELAGLIDDVAQSLKPLADEKNIAIVHNVPKITVTVSQLAVSQMLRILVENAVKYSPEKSPVMVSIEPTSNGGADISVHDNGPGIHPEHQAKIFDRFYRIDESRSSQHTAGFGLGLAIAKAIADRQGYRISVVSEVGKGSTFTLHM